MNFKLLALLVAAVLLGSLLFVLLRIGLPGAGQVVSASEANASWPLAEPMLIADPEREMAGMVPPDGPAVPVMATGSGPEDALAQIAAIGARLGPALDLVTPTPDLDVLWELRAIVERAGLSATTLLDAGDALPVGDPRARALTLAGAWGREPDETTDARLVARARTSGSSTEQEQHALAAVWALDLGERVDALEQYGLEAVRDAIEASEDELEFEGLANLRAWFALRAVPDVEADWSALFASMHNVDDSRVARELWALAARSDENHGATSLAAGRTGLDAALTGIAALSHEHFTSELAILALDPTASAASGWLAGAALQGLVCTATETSLSNVDRALGMGAVRRDQALEALRTFRPERNPARQVAALIAFAGQLSDDHEALGALAQGLDRAVSWTAVRRLDPRTRDELSAALETAALSRIDPSLGKRLAIWNESLR